MAKKRTDGRYRKTFTYNGKRYSVYSSVKKDLDQKIQEKLKELETKKDKHDNPTFDDYYERFTEFRRGVVKESTLCSQRKLYNFVKDLDVLGNKFKDLRIQSITIEDMKEIQNKLVKNKKYCNRTINDCMAHLKFVFKTAVNDEIILKNPCKSIPILKTTDKPKATKTIHRALTKDETKLFLDNSKGSFYYNCFQIMLLTGIRIGELGALRASDFDFKNGLLYITKTITKTELGGFKVGDTPKSDCGNREIPINGTIKKIVDNQKALLRKTFGLQYTQFLFPSSEGTMLHEYTLNREIDRMIKGTDINHFTSHAMRDTFATRFAEQHPELDNVKVLQKLMGHSDIKVTMNIYVQVSEMAKAKSMENLVVVV